jgi:nicotinic acid mononucleotide adenylyltransferase
MNYILFPKIFGNNISKLYRICMAEEKSPSNYEGFSILYTGSFSPVTNAHVMAVEKMIEDRRGKGFSPLRVVIVPASEKYKKDSLTPGNPDYLSEDARFNYLQTAFNHLEQRVF